MTGLIKELAKKSFLVVKNMTLDNIKTGKLDCMEDKGVVLRVGDVIKFGRVPFRLRESSI